MRIRSRLPKTGLRFGFDGPSSLSQAESEGATVDDILESLDRHTRLSDQLDPEAGLQADEAPGEVFSAELPRQATAFPRVHRLLGKYSFTLMLITGLMILIMYGAFTGTSSPTTAVSSILVAVLKDPVKLGLVGILFLLPVMMIRRRRGRAARLAWF